MARQESVNYYAYTMIDTTDITKMVKHIVRRGQGVADPHIMHPMREWLLGVSVVLLLVMLGAGLSFHLYRIYDSQRTTEITTIAPVVSYAAPTIAEAVSVYSAKRAVYEAVLGTPGETPALPTASSTSVTETVASSSESVIEEVPVVEEATSTVDDVPSEVVSPGL